MDFLRSSAAALLVSVAVASFLAAGVAATLGANTLRDRALRLGAACVVAAVALSFVLGFIERIATGASRGTPSNHDVPSALVVLAVVGHVVLAATLIARRLRGEEAEAHARELERDRARERMRVAPHGEDER